MTDHLIPPHGGKLVDLIVDEDRAAELKSASRDWPSHGPHPAPAVRPGAAAQRRAVPAHRFHGPRRPRARLLGNAAGRRDAVADADHARRRPRSWPRGWSPARNLALRDPEGVMLAVLHVEDVWRARPRSGGRGRVRLDQPGASRRRPSAGAHAALVRRRHAVRPAAGHALRLPPAAPHPARAAHGVRQARLDAGRRVPDAQPDAPRAPGADAPRGEGSGGEPAHPPGGRDDQAGRRRPLHARALLPGAAAPLPAQDGHAVAAAAGHAHGRPARGGVARDHPQEPRLHAPDRGPRPRRDRAATRRATRSTGRTTPRSCCASTRRSSASRWSRSS